MPQSDLVHDEWGEPPGGAGGDGVGAVRGPPGRCAPISRRFEAVGSAFYPLRVTGEPRTKAIRVVRVVRVVRGGPRPLSEPTRPFCRRTAASHAMTLAARAARQTEQRSQSWPA